VTSSPVYDSEVLEAIVCGHPDDDMGGWYSDRNSGVKHQ
jgi:hypothetical protein